LEETACKAFLFINDIAHTYFTSSINAVVTFSMKLGEFTISVRVARMGEMRITTEPLFAE
jgi:hypothetical protein